jgi:hypothetical protein
MDLADTRRQAFGRASDFFALVLLGANFVFFLLQATIFLNHSYAINLVEGDTLASTFLISKVGPYPDFTQWPYIPMSYPPLFYLAALPLHHFFFLGITAGRWVSFFSSLALAGIFGSIAYHGTKKHFWAGVFFLLFFVSPDVYFWALLYRVDMLMTFFLGLAIYFGLVRDQNPRERFWALFFLYLAFFTKSTCVVTLSTLLGYWVFDSFKKKLGFVRAVGYPVLFLVLVAATLFLMDLFTSGRYSLSVFGLMKIMTRFEWLKGFFLLKDFLAYAFWMILIAFCLTVSKITQRKEIGAKFIFCLAGFIGGILYLFCLGHRSGSDTNYVFEAYLWLFFILSRWLPDYFKKPLWEKAFKFVIAMTTLSFILTGAQIHHRFFKIADSAFYSEDRKVRDRLVELIKNTEGNVLVEDPTIAMRAGKTPVFSPFLMGNLEKLGFWDPSGFIREVESGRYPYIIAVDRLFSDSRMISNLIYHYYRSVGEYQGSVFLMWSNIWTVYQYAGYNEHSWG